MHQKSTLEEDINRIMASLDEEGDNEHTAPLEEPEPLETYHVYPVSGGMVILKEEEPEATQVIDSAPVGQIKQRFEYVTLCIVLLSCLPTLASITFQVYGLFNPPIATVTIMPKAQTVTLSGTLQLGRLLHPITLSQSQTVQTTGKGHQTAKAATGFITFYNGQLNSVSVPAGTVLTATDGVQVITEQDALIPVASPPIEGQIAVSAHVLNPGARGNIATGEINQSCCAIAVLAKNTTPFTGGQNERDFQTVAEEDISTVATPLKTVVIQSMQGALQGQLKPTEQLSMLPCTPTVTSDHHPGDEVTQVKVTVSQTCSAVAYTSQALEEKVTALLSQQAVKNLGTGYSLIGSVQMSVTQAAVTNTPSKPLVILSFHAQAIWVYAIGKAEQQQIKNRIAGKTKQAALHILLLLPGIEQASLAWSDDTKLPKDPRNIHLVLIVGA